MKAAEIVGRGLSFCLETGTGEVAEALTCTILYNHAEDLEEDIPLESVETAFVTYYNGEVPQEVEDWLEGLDEPWSPESEVALDI